MSPKTKALLGRSLVITWGGCVTAGFGILMALQMKPNATLGAPQRWPLANQQRTAQFNLVMTLHPQCPCSRASLDELQVILAKATKPVDVQILFVMPRGAPANWRESSNWRLALSIPGTHVLVDASGQRATLLGATTSGEVFLYNADGKLCFHGGITDGRGHEGDNPGMICVQEILRGQLPSTNSAPVYGCELGLADTTAPNESDQ